MTDERDDEVELTAEPLESVLARMCAVLSNTVMQGRRWHKLTWTGPEMLAFASNHPDVRAVWRDFYESLFVHVVICIQTGQPVGPRELSLRVYAKVGDTEISREFTLDIGDEVDEIEAVYWGREPEATR
jgi:hypothetical protein